MTHKNIPIYCGLPADIIESVIKNLYYALNEMKATYVIYAFFTIKLTYIILTFHIQDHKKDFGYYRLCI